MTFKNIDINEFIKFVENKKKIEEDVVYKLKIQKENKEIIQEEKKDVLPVAKGKENVKENQNKVGQQPSLIEFLKSKNPNEAEDVLIKNLIDRKDIDGRTKDWLQINQKLHSTPVEQKKNKPKMTGTFMEMLDFSLNFFNIVKNDINKGLNDLKNEQSTASQNVNKEFNKNFKVNLTPKDISSYSLFEFELLCVINRVHIGTYLKNIDLIMNQNQIIVNLLKNPYDLRTIRSSISIFKNSLEKYDITKDQSAIKKFDEIDREIKKRFDKSEAALADLNKSKNALYEHNRTMIENAQKFCEELSSELLNFDDKKEGDSDLEFAQKLSQAADAFFEEIETSNERIKTKLSKDMKELRYNFEKNLGKRKDSLQTRYLSLLKKQGLKTFSDVYDENMAIFKSIYQTCMSKISDDKLNEFLTLAKNFKQKYNLNLKKAEKEIEESKETKKDEPQANQDSQRSTLKITNNTTELTPVTVEHKD